MARRTWFACVAALLVVSTATFGTIISSGDWYNEEYGPGRATGGPLSTAAVCITSNGAGWGGGEGWQSKVTDTAGSFTWEYSLYAVAEAWLRLWSYESCEAYGYASVSADCTHAGNGYSASRSVSGSGHGGDLRGGDDDGGWPGGIYGSGTDEFEAFQGCSANHTALAYAYTPSNANSTATATAYAEAWINLF